MTSRDRGSHGMFGEPCTIYLSGNVSHSAANVFRCRIEDRLLEENTEGIKSYAHHPHMKQKWRSPRKGPSRAEFILAQPSSTDTLAQTSHVRDFSISQVTVHCLRHKNSLQVTSEGTGIESDAFCAVWDPTFSVLMAVLSRTPQPCTQLLTLPQSRRLTTGYLCGPPRPVG